MDAFRDINDIEFFGIPAFTLGLWLVAGLVAGALLMGRRPLGLLGDLAVGLIGGFFGGWLMDRMDVKVSDYIDGVNNRIANQIGEFFTALVGAIIVLLILRVVIRRPAE
jgi:uncharacterized membrane protein YeaQ/YmgE (transglycosylase-associated protein family)